MNIGKDYCAYDHRIPKFHYPSKRNTIHELNTRHTKMDDPKTRRESKKTKKEKKGEKYGQKHIRAVQSLKK
jgi:hypothetical protein